MSNKKFEYKKLPGRGVKDSEPHVVSGPSTHEEIMASDNIVIKSSYAISELESIRKALLEMADDLDMYEMRSGKVARKLRALVRP